LRKPRVFKQKLRADFESLVKVVPLDLKVKDSQSYKEGHKESYKNTLLIGPEKIKSEALWSELINSLKNCPHLVFAGAQFGSSLYEVAHKLVPIPPSYELSWSGQNYQGEEVFISRASEKISIFHESKKEESK
jgi:hypothetical protein